MYSGLQIRNHQPPVTLTRHWNGCLMECGCQLTAILINHHSECHQNNTTLKDIKLTTNTEFQSIRNEFQATIPELQSKLKFTENEITQLIETTEQQLLNQRKRNSNNPDDFDKPASKEPHNSEENDNNPTISEQVQSAIAKALGNITRANYRGHGRGRGRGRGGRGGPPRYFQ